jgi:hypothetical protein
MVANAVPKLCTEQMDLSLRNRAVVCYDVRRKADKFLDGLYLLYANAADKHNAHARMEIRVPLQFTPRVLPGIDGSLLLE